MKKYEIIYADPPWETGYLKEKKTGTKGYDLPYNTMTVEEIMALPIRWIAADKAILFMWVIDRFIPVVEDIMQAWGFKYKTLGYVWHKKAKHTKGENAIMSRYGHKSVELCFIGVKGGCIVENPTVKQFLSVPKREHSRKPDEIRKRIIQLCGDRPRIELFSRQKLEGWDAWGDQVPKEEQKLI